MESPVKSAEPPKKSKAGANLGTRKSRLSDESKGQKPREPPIKSDKSAKKREKPPPKEPSSSRSAGNTPTSISPEPKSSLKVAKPKPPSVDSVPELVEAPPENINQIRQKYEPFAPLPQPKTEIPETLPRGIEPLNLELNDALTEHLSGTDEDLDSQTTTYKEYLQTTRSQIGSKKEALSKDVKSSKSHNDFEKPTQRRRRTHRKEPPRVKNLAASSHDEDSGVPSTPSSTGSSAKSPGLPVAPAGKFKSLFQFGSASPGSQNATTILTARATAARESLTNGWKNSTQKFQAAYQTLKNRGSALEKRPPRPIKADDILSCSYDSSYSY